MNIKEAEKAIAETLKQLEIDTESLVESVGVNDTEVTTFSDDRQQIQRRVVIELRRSPGSNW